MDRRHRLRRIRRVLVPITRPPALPTEQNARLTTLCSRPDRTIVFPGKQRAGPCRTIYDEGSRSTRAASAAATGETDADLVEALEAPSTAELEERATLIFRDGSEAPVASGRPGFMARPTKALVQRELAR